MFGKTPKIDQKSKFGHTSKFSKIQILVENRTSVLTLRGFSTYNKKNIFLKTSMSGLKNPSKWYFREYFKIKKISGHMKFPISYISWEVYSFFWYERKFDKSELLESVQNLSKARADLDDENRKFSGEMQKKSGEILHLKKVIKVMKLKISAMKNKSEKVIYDHTCTICCELVR